MMLDRSKMPPAIPREIKLEISPHTEERTPGTVANILWRFLNKLWPSYKKHMDILEAVPSDQRDTDWLKASILLSGRHRRNWKRMLVRLGDLKRLLETDGKAEEFGIFFSQLKEVMHPYIVTPHGFSVPLSNKDTNAVSKELIKTLVYIELIGYKAFVNSGTLLGARRNGKFIAHDDDIDLAVILKAKTMREAAEEWQEFAKGLFSYGLLDVKHYLRSTSPIAKIRTPVDVTIDLFPTWFDDEDRCFIWPHTAGEVPKSEVMPLLEIPLHGIMVPAPKNSDAILNLNFGANWAEPDPSFTFPWEEARKKFSELIKQHKESKYIITDT